MMSDPKHPRISGNITDDVSQRIRRFCHCVLVASYWRFIKSLHESIFVIDRKLFSFSRHVFCARTISLRKLEKKDLV